MTLSRPRFAMLFTAFLAGAAPATAADGIVTARGWQQIDYAESGYCRAEVRGNGQFYRIAGEGFAPGSDVHVTLFNDAAHTVDGRAKPLDYVMPTDSDGSLNRYYIPFVPNRQGGYVSVSLDGSDCSLLLGFGWERRQP